MSDEETEEIGQCQLCGNEFPYDELYEVDTEDGKVNMCEECAQNYMNEQEENDDE